MFFADEDELAVHTVASAAYALLADLKTERGMDEAADVHLTSIFYVIRDFRRGSLPEDMSSDPEFMAWVRGLADDLPIQADTERHEVSVSLSRPATREFWNSRKRIANFLKHADRDSGESISLDEVNNFLLLMQCYSAYKDLTPVDLGNEGLVFELFMGVSRPDPQLKWGELAQRLGLDPL